MRNEVYAVRRYRSMFADIIVDDREDRPFMLVEVKASIASSETVQEFIIQLERADASISFGMFVDLEDVHLLKRDPRTGAFLNLVRLNTREVLSCYSPEFAGKDQRYSGFQFVRDYVVTLVEGWLRDLAYHWKTEDPPGADVLSGTGLLEKIKGGTTRTSEVTIDGGLLR
jgi:hypothetical protein